MKETARPVLMVLATLALLLVALLARPLVAPAPVQAQATPGQAAEGRYQIISKYNSGDLYFLDTRTGRLWLGQRFVRNGNVPHLVWREADSPVVAGARARPSQQPSP